MRQHIGRTLFHFTAAASITLAGIFSPSLKAEAKPAAQLTDRVNVEQIANGTFQYRLHGQVKFDRQSQVEVKWFDCTVDWTLPLTEVETTWCGVYSDGGSWKELGANYTVHVKTPWGWRWTSHSRHMRIKVHPDGSVSCHPSGCSYNYE